MSSTSLISKVILISGQKTVFTSTLLIPLLTDQLSSFCVVRHAFFRMQENSLDPSKDSMRDCSVLCTALVTIIFSQVLFNDL